MTAIYFESPKLVKPSRLADTFATTRSNVSHCVASLEAKGLLQRKIDPADARAYHLSLKPQGKKCALRVISAFEKLQRGFEREIGFSAEAAEFDGGLAVVDDFEVSLLEIFDVAAVLVSDGEHYVDFVDALHDGGDAVVLGRGRWGCLLGRGGSIGRRTWLGLGVCGRGLLRIGCGLLLFWRRSGLGLGISIWYGGHPRKTAPGVWLRPATQWFGTTPVGIVMRTGRHPPPHVEAFLHIVRRRLRRS